MLTLRSFFASVPPFFRGTSAAMGLLGAALPGIIPYSPLEITSFVHSVIIGWHVLISGVWGLIAVPLNLPEFPPQIISAAVFGLTLALPWAANIVVKEMQAQLSLSDYVILALRVCFIAITVPMLSLFIFMGDRGPLFWIATAQVLTVLIYLLVQVSKFRAGFMFVIGFLGVLEGLYFISTDTVRAHFDTFVCERQNVSLPQC